MTKHKNSDFDETQKLILWQNSKKQIVTKVKETNCGEKKKIDKTQKLKLWHNSKNSYCDKAQNSNCDGSNSDSSDSSS